MVMLALLILYLLQLWPPFHCIGITCVFFYTAGAYLSIRGRDLNETFSRWKTSSAMLPGILMILIRQSDIYTLLIPIWCIVWVVAFVNLLVALPLESHARTISLLSDSTFFVYVTHSVVLSNIRQAFLVLPPFHLSEATVFLLTAILTVAFCVSVYLFVRKCFPQLCVFICGR